MPLEIICSIQKTEVLWDSNRIALTARQKDILVTSYFWRPLREAGWAITPNQGSADFLMSRQREGSGGVRFSASPSLWMFNQHFADTASRFAEAVA